MTHIDERAAFLAAIRENPDDDTPRLVFADWLADRGEQNAERRLRYSVRAWSAIREVPSGGNPATGDEILQAFRSLDNHPQGDILRRLAGVAFCRRPFVWDQLTDPRSVRAIHAAREYVDGFIDSEELQAAHIAASHALHSQAQVAAWQCASPSSFEAAEVGSSDVTDEHTGQANGSYMMRVYEALAALPPMARS